MEGVIFTLSGIAVVMAIVLIAIGILEHLDSLEV